MRTQQIFLFMSLLLQFSIVQAQNDLDQPTQQFQKLLVKEQQLGILPENMSKLYLHPHLTTRSALIMAGLYDTPRFMSGLAQSLFDQGFNVISLRLSGHGTGRVEDLLNVRYTSWLEDLALGLKLAQSIGQKVTLIGHSTGGALAAMGGCQNPEVDSVVLMAPALKLLLSTQLGIAISAGMNLNSDFVCPDPNKGGAGCSFMDYINPVFVSQLKENLPVVPAAGRQVILLSKYVRKICGRSFQNLKHPVLMVSTASDNVISHNFNLEVSTVNHWQRLTYSKADAVLHPSVPKSKNDELAKNPLSHNAFFEIMRDRIVEFIFSIPNVPPASLPIP